MIERVAGSGCTAARSSTGSAAAAPSMTSASSVGELPGAAQVVDVRFGEHRPAGHLRPVAGPRSARRSSFATAASRLSASPPSSPPSRASWWANRAGSMRRRRRSVDRFDPAIARALGATSPWKWRTHSADDPRATRNQSPAAAGRSPPTRTSKRPSASKVDRVAVHARHGAAPPACHRTGRP